MDKLIRSYPTTPGSSHHFEGVFLGVSAPVISEIAKIADVFYVISNPSREREIMPVEPDSTGVHRRRRKSGPRAR
jgi:hypothetical protein